LKRLGSVRPASEHYGVAFTPKGGCPLKQINDRTFIDRKCYQ